MGIQGTQILLDNGNISKSYLGMTERRNLPQVCTNVRKSGHQGYIVLI